MKAVILIGGLGTRISEKTYLKLKPIIEIAPKFLSMDQLLFRENSSSLHNVNLLFLDIKKAKSQLKFKPKLRIQESLFKTINRYTKYFHGQSALSLCKFIILDYKHDVQLT